MEGFINVALVVGILFMIRPVNSQISILCSASMVRSFTPCINFVTDSGGTSSSPTADCCNSLKSLMSNGKDCLCLIITGGVPFNIPINKTLAAKLPRACKTSTVPIECKATGAPIPAPGYDPPQPPSRQPWPDVPAVTPPGPVGDGPPISTPGAMTPEEEDVFPMTPPGIKPDLSFALSSKTLQHCLLLVVSLVVTTLLCALNLK